MLKVYLELFVTPVFILITINLVHIVLHVYGSAYDMGYAHGQLLKAQIQDILPSFMNHVEQEIEAYLKDLPEEIRKLIAELGLSGALDLTHLLTE